MIDNYDPYEALWTMAEKRAKRQKICSAISIVAVLFSIGGIVALILGKYWLLYICAAVTIVDSIIQVTVGDQNNFNTEIIEVIIAGIVSLFGLNFFVCVATALCIGAFAATAIGYILVFIASRK